jgi:prophage maintenance system killer protein
VFLRLNGDPCLLDDDSAVDLVLEVAAGELKDVPEIAKRLRP